PVPGSPTGVAINSSGTFAFVTKAANAQVAQIDVQAVPPSVVRDIDVGVTPQGIAVRPGGRFVYVCNAGGGGTVSGIDTLLHPPLVSSPLPIPTAPVPAPSPPDGPRAYAPRHSNGTVAVIDANFTFFIKTITVGMSPSGVASTAAGDRVYITNMAGQSPSGIPPSTHMGGNTIPIPGVKPFGHASAAIATPGPHA